MEKLDYMGFAFFQVVCYINGMDRKRRFRKKEVIDAILKSHGLMKNVAMALGANVPQVKEYIAQDADLQALMSAEIEAMETAAADLIYKQIQGGDVGTAKWFLDFKSREGYRSDVQKVQLSIVDDMGD